MNVDLTANYVYTCSHLWLNGVVVYGHESVVDSVVSGFPLDCDMSFPGVASWRDSRL